MKRISLITALMLAPLFLLGQNSAVDNIFQKYQGQEGVTVVNISAELFQVVSAMDTQEMGAPGFPMDKLTCLKVLAIEDPEVLKGVNFYEEIITDLDVNRYAEVMTVHDGDEDVRMWMKNDGPSILEFLLVVGSPDENVLVYIQGDFTMNDIEGIAQSMGGMQGMDELNNLEID